MTRTLGVAALAAALAFAAPARAGFDDDFTGRVLRIDVFHSGTASEERIALDRVRDEGAWPGSRTVPIDPSGLGKYRVEVADAGSGRVLWTRGFADLFGEWETTDEAIAGTWRTFPEAFRVPEPRRPFQLRLRKRGPDGAFREIWTTTIDPASRFVDRAAAPPRDVLTVFENGTPATKVDLLFLGDGYAASEMERYHRDVRTAVDALFSTEPYRSRRSDFNVRAVDSPSAGSGVTRPRAGAFRATPLGVRYNTFDSERYVMTLDDRAWRDVAAAAPYDAVVILVNDRQYGGGGIFGLYATASAGSAFATYLVVHEFGHSFAGLGDEYFTSDVAYSESAAPPEPWEPNLTADIDRDTLKWRELLTPGVPLPTPWDKAAFENTSDEFQAKRRELRAAQAPEEKIEALFTDERKVMTRMLAEEPHAGEVGAFEGAGYRATGLYRPSTDCIMFTRDEVGFCPVCRRAIERAIDREAR